MTDKFMREKINEAPNGDSNPQVEQLENGEWRYILRIIRPRAASRAVKGAAERRAQTRGCYLYAQDRYDYRKLIPLAGSPASVEMSKPRIEIGYVRHLIHADNVVPGEAKSTFSPRVKELIKDLQIQPDTKVYVVCSETGQFVVGDAGIIKNRRAEQTAQVIMKELSAQGIDFVFNDIDGLGTEGLTPIIRQKLNEFPEDSQKLEDRLRHFQENLNAKKAGQPLPFPDALNVPPAVQASFAKDVEELEKQTGISEVASATVARNLQAFDLVEDHFLQALTKENAERVVVILAAHGQMGTDISEALNEVTDGKFPLLFATNGAYWRVKVGMNKGDEKVEEFVFETGGRTGMNPI